MKRLLPLAAVVEMATGVALLVVPLLVGRLLLGAELAGVSIPVARMAGIALIALGIGCWGRHVDLQRAHYALSSVSWHPRGMGRAVVVAGSSCPRRPDGAAGPRMVQAAAEFALNRGRLTKGEINRVKVRLAF